MLTRTMVVFDEKIEVPMRIYLQYQGLYNWTEEEMREEIERELRRKGGNLQERSLAAIERKIVRTESIVGKPCSRDGFVSCTVFGCTEVFVPIELAQKYEKSSTRLNVIQIEGLLLSEDISENNVATKDSEELSKLVVALLEEELEVYVMIPDAVKRAKEEFGW